MTKEPNDFLASSFNFFGHADACSVYREAIIVSGLHIPNRLGLENPLTLIYDNNASPILETNDENIFWFPVPINKFASAEDLLSREVGSRIMTLEEIYRQSAETIPAYPINLIDEGIDLVHPFRWYAFGHLHDSLTKLYSMKNRMYNRENVKYIISDPWRIRDFEDHLSALAGYNVSKDQIVNIAHTSHLHVDKLWHPLSPATPTNHTQSSYQWLLNAYFAYFSIHDMALDELIWLSRNSVRAGSRQVTNEDEVLEVLVPKGFRVVTGNEPLSEIVSLFARARIVMGAHGSLFVNTIFSHSSCQIVEFCPANRVDRSIQAKLKRAHNYQQITVPADEHFNITIPIDSLRALLEG